MKKGIELEYWVIDEEGYLMSAELLSKKFDFTAPEFLDPILEIKTDPKEDIHKLKKQIKKRMEKVLDECEERNLRIMPLGTPLNHGNIDIVKDERYQLLQEFNPKDVEMEREIARAGTHIHFEKQQIKNQLNILTALDPASALLNSSPYHKGIKVGSSSRNLLYRYWWDNPFPKHVELWEYIEKIEEWKQREMKRFNELKETAIQQGINEKTFKEHYSPEDSNWAPIRLRQEFPTVEYRSLDAALPSEIIKFTRQTNQIIEKYQDKEIEIGEKTQKKEEKIILPKFETVKERSRKAAKKGIKSKQLKNYLKNIGYELNAYNPIAEQITGPKKITMSEARQKHLKYADMLEKDIKNL
ncbi:MAG: glutamate-cysteine ligase family protein [Candidatus Nanohaloarchaea archaeon]